MISYTIKYRKFFLTDHALDRWWERCEQNEVRGRKAAIDLLNERMKKASWSAILPPWCRLSWWHHARAEGIILLDENAGFIINKNPNGDRVAVTYIENKEAA